MPIYDRDKEGTQFRIDDLKKASKRKAETTKEHEVEITPRLKTLFSKFDVTDLKELNDKLQERGGWIPKGEDGEELKIFGKTRKIMAISEYGGVVLKPAYMVRGREAKVNILSPEFEFLD